MVEYQCILAKDMRFRECEIPLISSSSSPSSESSSSLAGGELLPQHLPVLHLAVDLDHGLAVARLLHHLHAPLHLDTSQERVLSNSVQTTTFKKDNNQNHFEGTTLPEPGNRAC